MWISIHEWFHQHSGLIVGAFWLVKVHRFSLILREIVWGPVKGISSPLSCFCLSASIFYHCPNPHLSLNFCLNSPCPVSSCSQSKREVWPELKKPLTTQHSLCLTPSPQAPRTDVVISGWKKGRQQKPLIVKKRFAMLRHKTLLFSWFIGGCWWRPPPVPGL